jgi:hypothetical protein
MKFQVGTLQPKNNDNEKKFTTIAGQKRIIENFVVLPWPGWLSY